MKIIRYVYIFLHLISLSVSYYLDKIVQDLRSAMIRNDQGFRDQYFHDIIIADIESYTKMMAIFGTVVFVFSIIFWITHLIRFPNNKLVKTLAVIDVVLLILFTVWAVIIYSSPSHISFDEISLVWMLFFVINIIFGWLILSKGSEDDNTRKVKEDETLLDQLEFS
ncbi:MAG: hypothetical protein H6600_07615 [Flavobacteriales bacterium]|nr:hypothetical protein [Flavobacteriales bacterium]MCB9198310.1 hypothetical protein [Flavobacteriales bacterium]